MNRLRYWKERIIAFWRYTVLRRKDPSILVLTDKDEASGIVTFDSLPATIQAADAIRLKKGIKYQVYKPDGLPRRD